MKTFKNISDSVFQDGNLIVKPGDAFTTDNPGRLEQMTGLYAWQFEETTGEAPTEDELKANVQRQEVHEVISNDHVRTESSDGQMDMTPVDGPEQSGSKPNRGKK